MKDLRQIQADIEASTSLLQAALAGCSNEDFNMRLNDDQWTAAEIIEHLLLVETSVNKQFGGPSGVTQREVDKKVEIVKNLFEDDRRQYDSPAVFIPSKGEKNKMEMLEKLLEERRQLALLASRFDLTETLLAFKHPYLGAFTRYEWIYFVILHSNRHLLQLKKILARQ